MPWGTVREALGRAWGKKAEGLLPQMHFVPWIVLGGDFRAPMTNICIQFIRYVYSCQMLEHNCKNPIWPVYPEYAFGLLPCFLAFPDMIHNMWQAIEL